MFAHVQPKERVVYVVLASMFLFGVGFVGARRLRPPPRIVIQTSSGSDSKPPAIQFEVPKFSDSVSQGGSSGESSGPLVVHVVGAVKHPGLVRLTAGSRINDAIQAAGGVASNGDPNAINLAAKLTDGEQISVPLKGSHSTLETDDSAPLPKTGGKHPASPIDLATATRDELEQLPGVGPAMADKILAYRQDHGGIGSVDDLRAVRGLGPKKLEKIRPWVR